MRKETFGADVGRAVLTLGLGLGAGLVGCMEAEAQEDQAGVAEPVEFSETSAIVEINATDGDVGFQALLDADAWKEARIDDPEGKNLFLVVAKGRLLEQGLTENFFESDEPPCAADPADPDAEFVPLSEFLERFPAGNYQFSARTIDNEKVEGSNELTHNLPAAPTSITFDGSAVTWASGTDLGGCQDDTLVSEGIIPDPAIVPVVVWEVTVEPADAAVVDPLRTYTVQIPGQAPKTVIVPPEFVNAYAAEGVTAFKVEVGAIEASGNRTFSEGDFELGETGAE